MVHSRIPTRRRIGSTDYNVIYDGGIQLITEITAAIGGLKATFDLINIAIDKRDAGRLNEYKLTVANQLLELNMAANSLALSNSQLINEKKTLENSLMLAEEKIRDFEQAQDEAGKYELCEPYPGTFAYVTNEQAETIEPKHYLCQPCKDNARKKSILQFHSKDKDIGTCHVCGKGYRFKDATPVRKPKSSTSSYLTRY